MLRASGYFLKMVWVFFHDHERCWPGLEFTADAMAYAAETAKDVMISEFSDATFQFFSPKDCAQLTFQCELEQTAKDTGNHACAADDQDNGE